MRPLVSVVVPTYNRLDLVRPVLDGFAAQRAAASFEVIVVDDGSDPPVSVLAAGRDDRFRVVTQPNRGRAGAVNTGLAAARGQILIVCDSDIVPGINFIDEHVAFHRDHPGVHETHLGALTAGVPPSAFAALLGPWANPRMCGTAGPVPWTLWFTNNWSLKRKLFDTGIVTFDEAFRVWGWEDLELGYRLAKNGIRNTATSAACGLHLQTPSLDDMLRKFAGSVMNLVYLATRVQQDDAAQAWMALRDSAPRCVEIGEVILRHVVATVETIADRLPTLDPTLVRLLGTSLSDTTFRCGTQRGFVLHDRKSGDESGAEFAGATIEPYADVVRIACVCLVASGKPAVASDMLDFCTHKVSGVSAHEDLARQFTRRATYKKLHQSDGQKLCP